MFCRSAGHAFLIGVMLAVVSLCLVGVARADEMADLRAAIAEAKALEDKSDYPGAATAWERASTLAARIFGPEHSNTATVMNNLALVYQNLGQYAKAEPLYQRSLEITESIRGPDHAQVATSLNNLAVLYDKMGRYAKAEPLFQRSLKIRESQLGRDHPDVAQIVNNQAHLYLNMGQYAKAESLFQRSLKILESKLGPDHALVAQSLNNLGMLYVEIGQYARAELLYRRSLKIKETQLGTDHPSLANSLNSLAVLYLHQGQYARAEPLYRRCITILESKLGPDHPYVAASLNNLAALYSDMGQHAKAELLCQRSVKIREARLGPDHVDVATSLNNLANHYARIGQDAKAEPLYRRSLEIRLLQYGPKHPAVATSMNNLALVCKALGKYSNAELLHQSSVKLNESQLGPDHPSVATSVHNLAALYSDAGEYAKAEPLFQRSLKIWQSKLGPDHPLVATSLNSLAIQHAAADRWAEATAEIDRARRIVRSHVARTLPILSEKEQLTFLHLTEAPRLYIALSLGLQQQADAKIAERSAGWVLNGKAVAQEVLAQRSVLAVQGSDPTLAELVKQLQGVRRRLASLSLRHPKPEQEAEYRRQLETLNQEEQELSRKLGEASGRNTTGDPWIELAAVRESLPNDAVLIEVARFHVHRFKEPRWLPPRYAAWLIPAVGQGRVSIVGLGEAQKIDDAVQTARDAFERAEKTIAEAGETEAEMQIRRAMRDLARLVFEPLEKHFGNAQQLIVSPDAALWLIPWGALPVADGKYAIEKFQIRYCVSGRDLVSRVGSARQETSNPILFANPDYNLKANEADAATRAVLRDAAPAEHMADSRGLGSVSSLPKVARLPGTATEAAAIRPNVSRYAKAEPTVYEDQYALEGIFKALRRPMVLVLSTHGFFMPGQEAASKTENAGTAVGPGSASRDALTAEGKPLENPLLRCGLLLAGCNRQADDKAGLEDGILTGLEIVGTDLHGTELVVLSACDTGLGQVRNGEGVAGLRQTFQLAGAKAVVATLWQIPDQETADLINALFENLSRGQTKAEALRHAQLAQIRARREQHSAAHPYYWAAFTLTGE